MNIEDQNRLQANNQFLTFSTCMYLVDVIVWSYFYILLYREIGSFTGLFIDYLLLLVGLWVGFMVGSFNIHRIGILNSFRLSFTFLGITSLITLFFLDDIAAVFIPLALVRGIARGMFWPSYNIYQLREIDDTKRGYVLNSLTSIQLIFNVVIPILAGALIDLTGEYNYIFAIGIIVYFLGSIIPWSFNKIPKDQVTLNEVLRVTKNKNFTFYSFSIIFEAGLNSIYSLLFLIIPFLFLEDEFSVGVFTSFIGIISAVISFIKRNDSLKKKIVTGYLGGLVYSIGNLVLAIFWQFPILVFRNLGHTLAVSTVNITYSEVDYMNRELLLGDFKNESAIEMNIVNETLLMIGRLIGLLFVILVLVLLKEEKSIGIIRVIIGVTAFWKVISLFWAIKIKERLRK